jgi:hypothetical protein
MGLSEVSFPFVEVFTNAEGFNVQVNPLEE